jgi:gamma-butyrobetaine dioxygenase
MRRFGGALYRCAMTAFHERQMGPAGQAFPSGALLDVHLTDTGVMATFQGGTVPLLADWLRDNCQCDVCRIVQTDERRWQPWSDTEAPEVLTAEVDDGALHLRFVGGHESTFDADSWRSIGTAMRRGSWTARIWTGEYQIERFDHDQALLDIDVRQRMFEAFRRDGAFVVTGSPTIPGTVMDFVRGVGLTLWDSSLGLIFDVKLDPAGYNIAFTSEEVPPHNDNAQYTHPPSGQVLAMLVNDAEGGESVVVDTLAVLHQLQAIDPSAIDVLCRVQVGFRQYSPAADAFTRAPLVVRDHNGQFTHLRFSNQLRQPIPFDEPELGEWYRAYRALGRLVADPANHVSFRLSAGDTLFVNNHRVLHSRKAYVAGGARHLQDVYFNADDVFGSLDRMNGTARNAMVAS